MSIATERKKNAGLAPTRSDASRSRPQPSSRERQRELLVRSDDGTVAYALQRVGRFAGTLQGRAGHAAARLGLRKTRVCERGGAVRKREERRIGRERESRPRRGRACEHRGCSQHPAHHHMRRLESEQTRIGSPVARNLANANERGTRRQQSETHLSEQRARSERSRGLGVGSRRPIAAPHAMAIRLVQVIG